VCDECGSGFVRAVSQMAQLCPECAHWLYGFPNCEHEFVEVKGKRHCRRCSWDGSRSEYIESVIHSEGVRPSDVGEFNRMYSKLWTGDLKFYLLVEGRHPLDQSKTWYGIFDTRYRTILVIENDDEHSDVVAQMLAAGVRVVSEVPPPEGS